MKKTIGFVALLGSIICTVVLAQETKVFTRPAVPSREALEPLNLKLAWRVYIPTDGQKDGIYSVQMLGQQVIVQTRSGAVVALNALDGTTQWRARFGLAYKVNNLVGHNNDTLFAIRGTYLYAVDRKTGQLRWDFEVPNALAAAPSADEERLYLCLGGNRFSVYDLPEVFRPLFPGQKRPEKPSAMPARESTPYGARLTAIGGASERPSGGTGPQPQFVWDFRADSRLEQAPILTNDLVVLAGTNGAFFVASKVQRQVPYEFQTGAAISAPVGFHSGVLEGGQVSDMAYVASQDFNVYALDVTRGRILWRVTGGAPILKKPEVTDEDLYIAPEGAGLFRINRLTGETLWKNKAASRYLSSNKKFVYAVDRSNKLLIIDRALGSLRGSYDSHDFVVPISNEWTDRFFLAANDGLLFCLHDREYVAPVWTKTMPAPKKPPEKKADDKKEEAAPKDKDKEKDMPKEKDKEMPKEKEKDKEKEKEDKG